MYTNYGCHVVTTYVDQCLALGPMNHAGEDVAARVNETVDIAFDRFELTDDRASMESKRDFIRWLRINADLLGQATPLQAKVLMDPYMHAIS